MGAVIHLVSFTGQPMEFVGGDISNGGPVLVSSSPTRNEHYKSHQSDATGHEGGDVAVDGQVSRATSFLQCEDPPGCQPDARHTPARRGHAHRRSGAISNHDLSTILRPSTDGIGGSAKSECNSRGVWPADEKSS